MIDIKTEFFKTGMLLDKTTQPLTSFPYSFDDIKIKSNDYVTDKTFNDCIKKLHYNFLYLYRGCNVSNFEVFDSYYYSLSSIKNAPYYKVSEYGYNLVSTSNSLITATSACVILPYNNRKQSSYMFVCDPNYISCFETGLEVLKFVFKTNNIDPLSGDIKFKDIIDIKSDYSQNLYILDRGYNSIYQYNIYNFITDEYIYREQLFTKNIIGGLGGVTDNNKFNGIKNLGVGSNIVVVQDVNNKCFKIFDKNLNWLNTAVFEIIFNREKDFNGIILDKFNNLYCGKGSKIYKFKFLNDNNTYEYDSVSDIKTYLEEDEFIRSFHSVPSNLDMFYVHTNKSIKKIWFSSLSYVLGQFNLENNIDRDIKWAAVSRFDNNRDLFVLYSLKNNLENLSVNLDKTNYNSLLNLEDVDIYELEDLLINKDEYVQSWVILSRLSKLNFNVFALLQNIKYKYSETKGLSYPIIDKKIYNKGFFGYITPFEYEKNFDIGLNEIFQSSVINRVLKEIYNFQLTVMLYVINNESSIRYLSPDPYINNPTSKRYIYFVDESLLLNPNPITLNIFEELSPGAGILASLGGAPLITDDSIGIVEGVNI